ncbi:peptidylprolyl isomerase [Pseudodesulfovibrio piezophilus]|uniref:peptidylprolyl isomerase n=1 Tax=Pseudodesulfovibrio piezophilus (strain DSM 21447 / JCM 15486 / C1TLV30) TaxID=1322246 RepID=M1WWZ2_PSEP2|nr:peptidylprolyl isomerase [Pseudodesulfovibrio piezophilus]CCH49398.1 Peptidyl-prolyl cis-trans isomerase cyp18 [Pseudodesulfovibrio piezophilus C1TLV30]
MKSFKFVLSFTLLLAAFLFGPGMSLSKAVAAGPNPVVIMDTTAGRVIVMLYPSEAPITVENFLRYVDAGFYEGTIFHRVIKEDIEEVKGKAAKANVINIVQGGGFTFPPLRLKYPLWAPIENEDMLGLQNDKGTIAMARANDPDSATCQFFFNMEDNPALNPSTMNKKYIERRNNTKTRRGYCAFGKVIRGWDTLVKIQSAKTTQMGRYTDVPVNPVYIKKIYRAK